ncbi:hypothetical protein Q224_02703, partial [Staphylococcus aureus M1234]
MIELIVNILMNTHTYTFKIVL